MIKKLYTLLALMLFINIFSISSNAYEAPDDISVCDYAGLMSESAKSYIKSKNDILFSKTEAKIIIVTTDTTDGMTIFDYTQALYDNWSISSIGRRNSVLFVIDTSKKEYSFVQGKNIRYALTESHIYDYIIESFEPHFSNEEYDKAILSLYNTIGKWYENHYNDLSLGLDDDVERYLGGEKSRDERIEKSYLWVWISGGVCLVILIVVLKIKRNIELKIRQHERRRLKKKFQIDIDKIVNS